MFTWSAWSFFWMLVAGLVVGFGWAAGCRLFGRLFG